MTNPWEKYQASAVDSDADSGPWSAYAPVDAEPAPTRSLARSAGDSAIALGTGAVQGVKMLTDVAGAGNAASRALGSAADALTDLESPYRKAQKQERAAKIKTAEASGSTWEEVKAHAGAFADAPIDTTLNALGTSLPTLAVAAVPGLGQAALATRAAQAGVGVAQGVGNIKGQVHEAVKQKHLEAGSAEEEATRRADAAQAYGGDNAGAIALGGALGGLAGSTGAESVVRRLAGRQIAGEAVERTAPGLIRSAVTGVAKEAPMEAAQGGQERLASNVALQGEGFDVPTWQGVAGQAALEGLAAAPMGGGFGAAEGMRGRAQQRADTQARQNAEAAAADAQAKADAAIPPWSTQPGAADPNAAGATGVASAANAPAVAEADFSTSPGASAPREGGMDFTREVDTSGLSLQDPAEATAQQLGYSPLAGTPTVFPDGSVALGSEAEFAHRYAPQPVQRPHEAMGIDPNAGPLSKSAALAVDSGAYMPPAGQAPAPAPKPDPVVLQNRDRTSAASIAQMQEIAANPDYLRVGPSRDMTSGAPIVFGELPPTALLGRPETVVDGKGERMGTQYAVVDAGDLIASNNADGTAVQEYASGAPGKLRSVAGNGRTAGLQAAYQLGTAQRYRQELAGDAASLGVDAQALGAMQRPVLVRVMQGADVTRDMGDRTNITTTQKLSPLEQAGNDERRLDVRTLSFDEGGNPTPDSIKGFVSAMPVAERGDMLNPDGTPTRQAVDRLMAATFKQAYESDELVQLYAQATDPDARAVMAAAADASGVLANLKGAGEFDVRAAVADAAKMAVNAARQGMKLSDVLQNQDLDMHPEAFPVAAYLAQHIRTPKRMAEGLRRWGQLALEQARIAQENTRQGSLLGPRPTLTRAEIFARLGSDDNPAGQGVAPVAPTPQPAPEQTALVPAPQSPQSQPNGEPNGPQADQAQQATPQQPETPAPSAVDRHPTWRQNAIQAGRVARELGLEPQGKRLTQIVAEIDAYDAAQNQAAAPAKQAQPVDLELAAPTPADIQSQQQAQEQAAKADAAAKHADAAAAQADDDRKRIASASVAAADSFELGQDPLDSLTGQGGLMFSRSVSTPQEFVPNPDGGLDYGEITPEMGRAMRRQAGVIRLRQGNEAWGLTHIEARHGEQFKSLGFKSAGDYIAHVASNFNAVYQGSGAGLSIVLETGRTGGRLMVQLEASPDGDFYDVKTASPVRAGQYKNEKPLWQRAGTSAPTAQGSSLLPRDQSGSDSVAPKDNAANQDIRFSFAGARAATADTMALTTAQERLAAGEDAEAVRQDTGWHKGTDGKWRFEISDDEAKVNMALLANLHRGGFDARSIEHVSYRKDDDGTYRLRLAPKNPQAVSDLVGVSGIPANLLPSLLPQSALDAIERNQGDEDFIGANLDDARTVRAPFEFAGFNALPLEVVMDHPKLFSAYPALRDIMVRVDRKLGNGATFVVTDYVDGAVGNVIKIGNPLAQAVGSVLLHEIQHGIQDIEGFATGGSIESARAMQEDAQSSAFSKAQGAWYESRTRWPSSYKALMDQRMMDGQLYEKYDIKTTDEDGRPRKAIVLAVELRQKISEADKAMRSQAQLAYSDAVESELGGFGSDAFSEFNGLYGAVIKAFEGTSETPAAVYKRLAGEVEARNTQTRQKLTDAERRATAPSQTADVADADVIVVFNGKEMANAPVPANALMSPEQARAILALGRPPERATKESVRAAVRELVNGLGLLPNSLGRIVVATSAEIKQEWEPLIGAVTMDAEGAGRAQGFYDPKSRTVFLIADHIQAGDELGVAAHELMHKHGPAVLGKENWDQLHGAIGGWAKTKPGSMERIVYDEAARRVRASGPELSNQELFPYAVQVALEMGVRPNAMAPQGTVARWLAQVRAALRQVWSKIAGGKGDFNSLDLVNLAFGIAQRENPAHAGELDNAIKDGHGEGAAKAQTQTEAFQRWFGDSKVVDAQGKPRVVFHGTAADFNEFATRKATDKDGRKLGMGWGKGKFYFAETGQAASSAAQFAQMTGRGQQQNVMPVYLAVQRPIDVSDYLGQVAAEQASGKTRDAAIAAVDKRIRAQGIDGIMDSDTGGIAVFDPRQIKSATGNNGRFDPDNSDIRFSRANPTAIESSMGAMTPDQEAAYKKVAGVQKVPTLKERADAMKANLGLRMKQALVDQFAPIRDVSQHAYMMARMSKASDGAMDALLLYGKPFLRDGVLDVNVSDGGFAKVLAGLKGEHDRFFMWVAAQRGERLKAEGKENLMGAADISALKTLNAGQMADGTARIPLYAKALQELNAFNEAALKVALESGLIDQDAYDLMKNQPYVPFYRLMEEEGGMVGPKFSAGLLNQKAWKKLKGGTQRLNADLLQNSLHNWSHLYAASARNRAALATMDAAETMGIAYKVPAEAKGSVKVMRAGMTEHWMVEDPYLLEAVSALNYTASPLMKPLAKMKQLLTWGVTVNPTFKIRNLIRDSVSAISQSELGYNPLANVGQGWKLTASDSQIYASMLASGGIIKFGTQENTDRLRAQVAKLGGVVLDEGGLKKFTGQLKSLYDVYAEFGDRTENVNRTALYDQLIKKGHSHAEASFMARDLMDFSMGGSHPAVRFLTQTVPFLNARLQGLYKLGRAAHADPRKFAAVAGAVSLASLALLAIYSDDEDWKKREDWDRDAYWWFKVGETAFRIPKPFEVGAIGTLAERTAELMFEKEMTNKRFMERVGFMFGQTFAFNPVPQAIKPLLDIYANKDGFTKRAIESQADQRLRPQDRYNERTSEVARLLGSWGLPDPAQLIKGEYAALSPKQIDYLLRGYFSWAGATAATVSDFALRPVMDRGERPDMRLRDVFIAGNFAESLPTGSSRYVSQLYEQARSVEQAYASYREAIKTGDMDKAAQIQERDGAKLRNRMAYANATKQLSEINAQAKRIEANRLMSGDVKRERLTQLELRRGQVAKRLSDMEAD